MLYRGRFLFSGDHAWSDAAAERVVASHRVCWYDWDLQTASMTRLLDHRFEWLLPGHGLRCRLPPARMHQEVERCVGRMKRVRAIAR
jgi:glyoxylase-like metal-dependent hydrolase (beta-lactamase superfamily II)